jgi:hypothetical protein
MPAVRSVRRWNGPINFSPGSSRRSTNSRGRLLEAVNLKLDKLRLLLRLTHELQLLDHRRYEHAARGVDEIGRLVGGWIKANRAQTTF